MQQTMTDDRPVFPPEIFGEIIDILAIQTPAMALTDIQIATLQVCILVCKLFQTLSEPHLYRYVSFGLQESGRKQLNRLADLLETRPIVMEYIRHINFNLKDFRPTPDNETTTDFERIDLIVSLPNVESVNINYSRVTYLQPETLNPQNPVGSLCHRIIEGHVLRGTLRSLIAKKLGDIPFTLMATRTMLHTLSLDRCDLTALSQAMPSVKHLTLRKIYLLDSTFSYFPNLEELHLMHPDICQCDDPSRFSAPSFKITTLVLERCNGYGGTDINDSITSLRSYFQSKAHEQGVQPFEKLHTFGISLPDYSTSPIKRLLKDAPNLQNIILSSIPGGRGFIQELIRKFNHTLESFQYVSEADVHMPDFGVMSQTALMQHYMSQSPSFSIDTANVKHPAWVQALTFDEDRIFDTYCRFVGSWEKWLALLKDIYPNIAGVTTTEILMIDPEPLVDKDRQIGEVAERIATMGGRLWSLHISGINDRRVIHPMKVIFIAE
ncbi:hypothetical protein BJ165DRAFT_1530107 [Panaeolus papilionaceus]|nr:hypothetical protein BJ165DRAFT_1530107 [Panaeolus papilionaceus]